MSYLYPNPSMVAFWLSANRYSGFLASNKTTILSVDFPPVVSCPVACTYCYARRGRQAMARAVELQAERYQRYRENPEGYAAELAEILRRFELCFGLAVGSERFPLRLFGAGDCGNVKTFRRFHAALVRCGISSYGYSRYLGIPGDLWYSADSNTSPTLIARAKREGRRVAFVRMPDDLVPDDATLVFPEHRLAKRVPVDGRDCPKIRNPHEPGVCYECKRCFSREQAVTVAA